MDTAAPRQESTTDSGAGRPGLHFTALGLGSPPRSRRRGRPDRLTRMLLAGVALAVAFALGAQVGKALAPGAGPPTGPPAAARTGPASPAELVAQVKLVDGTTLHLVDRDGRLITVETTDATRVTRTGPGTLGDLRPGDPVTVRGDGAADGVVSATVVTYTG